MVDYESNTIKPVNSLDTIVGLAPSRPRDERKRRQQLQQDQEQPAEGDELLPEKKQQDQNNRDNDGIDYRA